MIFSSIWLVSLSLAKSYNSIDLSPSVKYYDSINIVQNGGFEAKAGEFCKSEWCSFTTVAAIAPWTVTSPKKSLEVDSQWPSPTGGKWTMDLNADEQTTIEQTIKLDFGRRYNFKLLLNSNPCEGDTKTISVAVLGTSKAAAQTFTHTRSSNRFSIRDWDEISFKFTAKATTGTIRISSLTPGGCGPVIDNVRVAPVTNNLIENGSFENRAAEFCAQDWCVLKNQTAIAPWKVVSDLQDFEVDSQWPTTDGGRWTMDLSSTGPVAIQQTIKTDRGARYRFRMKLNQNPCVENTKFVLVQLKGSNVDAKVFQHDRSSAGFNRDWTNVVIPFTAKRDHVTVKITSLTLSGCGPVIDDVSVAPVTNLLENGSFEDEAGKYCKQDWCYLNDAAFAGIAPWKVTSDLKTYEVDSQWPTTDGGKWTMDLSSTGPFSIQQTINVEEDEEYTFSMKLNGNPCGENVKNISVQIIGSDLPVSYFTHTVTPSGFTALDWKIIKQKFTATGDKATVKITSLTSSSCGPVIDAVSVRAVV